MKQSIRGFLPAPKQAEEESSADQSQDHIFIPEVLITQKPEVVVSTKRLPSPYHKTLYKRGFRIKPKDIHKAWDEDRHQYVYVHIYRPIA